MRLLFEEEHFSTSEKIDQWKRLAVNFRYPTHIVSG
jgi:hypothetical protein